ncbi:MAG: F0F1 ATP synthase subunit A [Bacteroidia bacterium]|nr:F0F1 ATP synthase subunit A [Bacteroidia bacterium]
MKFNNKKIIRYLVPAFLVILYVAFSGFNALAQQHHTDTVTHQSINANEQESGAINVQVHGEADPEEDVPVAPGHKEGKIDAGKLIMEHIGDAHDWHIWTYKNEHLSIPLPVIIKDHSGIKMFSSSRFHHGHATYEGYKLEKNKLVAVNGDGSINSNADFYDLSITKNVMSMFISVLILCWIMLTVARQCAGNKGRAPRGFANIVEQLVLFVRDEVAKPSIGPKYAKFLPYLLTIFFFIFINNLFGLIPFFPGGANVTGNIAITMVLAVITFIITTVNGNKNYWGHILLPPGVPKALWILLIPIEIIGMFNKPIVLMIRLFANITAGHIIILGFFSLIFIFGSMSPYLGYGVSVVSVAFTVFMNFIELLVAFLQAYVFTLLSALYFGTAVEEHHTAEHH